MTVKLTSEEMRYITLFEGMTGARVRDCIIDEGGGRVVFVVKKGDIGLAIGRGGERIRRARQVIGKSVEIVEHSDDLTEFLKNAFAPAVIKGVSVVEQEGKKVAMVTIERQERGKAIGAKGKKLRSAKKLANRHYGIHDISIV